uniref:Uncharacterized protein n=1 Tax=Salvator merianae TaxID=96440 RepID=A0A8D0C3N9_SALMN
EMEERQEIKTLVYNMPGSPAAPYPYPIVSPKQLPRDYVVWSLVNSSFMNVAFLGFVALVFSFKSRDCKVVGDIEGAAKYGSIAKKLNILALILGIVFFVIIVVMIVQTRMFTSVCPAVTLRQFRQF